MAAGSELLQLWRDPPTHKRVWAIALPMILSNISVPLVGLVDTAVIGHLDGAHFLGGVAVGSTLFTFILWAAGFLRMGTTGFAAQACGAEDGAALRRVLLQPLWLALLISLLVWLFQTPLLNLGLHLLDSSQALLDQARLYVGIRLYSLPAALANFVLIGWFIGAQNSRAPFVLLLAVNLCNVALDLLLVVALEWGVAGAAWATVISDYLGLLLGLALLQPILRRYTGQTDWLRALLLRGAAPLIRVNRDILIRTLALESVFYLLVVQGARLGDEVVAANAVLLNFLLLTSHGLDGLAHALEALGGHALGRQDKPALRKVLVVSTLWSLLLSCGFVLVFLLGGNTIIALLTDLPQVRQQAGTYLPWMAVMPLAAVWSYLLDGLFIGASRARAMRNAMLAALLLYLPLAWSLQGLGNQGVWLGFLCFMLLRSLLLGGWFVHLWRADRWMARR
ncbi:multidrug resistance protein, MATE family [Halopseudomonas sabulinigri]|uniref:Multidrug resistance protein, MATE family n=1 Tax=Halopseudomonas sabulinigri TaxID=472181 RepID=A0A1H1QJB5_9GAMM|nr:MATE family efflux transporter DinF [Halopseudomonas sabulinigri]SDS23413.1 multidrug resistance protein, MATE family [Halopseudomonas sabulinigri]